jgi:hypothetical protein
MILSRLELARFCLPQSIESWSSPSPGRLTFDWSPSFMRDAILSLSSPAGSARAASSSPWASRMLAACVEPSFEPAAPSQRVFEPCAGTVTLYWSSPPVPLPNGPSSQALGSEVPSFAAHACPGCGPRKSPPVSCAVPFLGLWVAPTSAA